MANVEIESYPNQRLHFLVVRHEEGQGIDPHGRSTTIGQFPSRKAAEQAKDALDWYGRRCFNEGRRWERGLPRTP